MKKSVPHTKITGRDEEYQADVILEDGIRKLAVSKLVQVESLSGKQEAATTYFFVNSVADNQTLRIQFVATEGAPAIDKNFTVNPGEDKLSFVNRITLEMNQDFVDFQPYYKATDIADNAAIFFTAKTIGEAGEALNVNDFKVSGTVPTTRAFDNLKRRGIVIQASASTKDPRLGIFGIQGTVESRDASVQGLLVEKPFNITPNVVDLNVDGSITPKVFTFPMDSIFDYFVSEIKFFGRDNGIQFSNFLGSNGALTNGILIEIKTDNNIVFLPPIKTTDDFDDIFSFGGSNFDVYFASGADKFSARFLSSAFPLRRTGTFGSGNDDYIKITIRDDLRSINHLQSIVAGFRQEA